MVDYSVTNHNPYNMYPNYGYNFPAFSSPAVPVSNFNIPQIAQQPQTDSYTANNQTQPEQQKQGLSTGAKVAIGSGIVTALAIGADFVFCKGKHIKSIFSKTGKKVSNNGNSNVSKPNTNPVNTAPSTPSKPVNTPNTTGTNGSKATNKTPNPTQTVQQPILSVDKMRAYVAKKTGVDYRRRPQGNYAEAIYHNYEGIRCCPKDYYIMNKSYDTNKIFDISSKGSKDIYVDDNDGMGWFYRVATKNLQPSGHHKHHMVFERISLNVYPEEGLIKALDNFITHTNVDVEYKVPQVFKDWLTRHDPITMYFREDIPQSVKDEIIKIVSPYVRKSSKGENMLGTKLADGIYQVPNPSEQDVLNLVKRAEKLGDDKLVECLKSTAGNFVNGSANLYAVENGKKVVKASAGQFRAAEMLIEDLERLKNGTI